MIRFGKIEKFGNSYQEEGAVVKPVGQQPHMLFPDKSLENAMRSTS